MTRAKPKVSEEIRVDLGDLNPKQKLFCKAKSRYVAYGGARGGGKTHVSRIKAFGGALSHPGIRILFIRREYPELEQTVIIPMKKMIPEAVAHYNGSIHMFDFENGSIIKYGHFGPGDEEEYQGQEWDWIFMDEATQFTEEQFTILGACLRGASKIPRHMFLTCNPGGIGHMWVKRIFVDRDFRPDEDPKDFTFIPATVDDNPQLLEGSPEYKKQLELLPEHKRRAWLHGDWDALAGTFFPEFRRDIHVVPPVTRPDPKWRLYRALDYGLDMLACYWVGVDYDGRAHVYRELCRPGLIVKDAAKLIQEKTLPGENILSTFAPGDLWSRQKDTGRTMAEIFALSGLPLIKASRERVQGWQCVKDWLAVDDTWQPGMTVTEDCKDLIKSLENIQADEKNPDDCATIPHDITHATDALRYFAVSRTLAAERPVEDTVDEDLLHQGESYDDFMCGSGAAGEDYINFGFGG